MFTIPIHYPYGKCFCFFILLTCFCFHSFIQPFVRPCTLFRRGIFSNTFLTWIFGTHYSRSMYDSITLFAELEIVVKTVSIMILCNIRPFQTGCPSCYKCTKMICMILDLTVKTSAFVKLSTLVNVFRNSELNLSHESCTSHHKELQLNIILY